MTTQVRGLAESLGWPYRHVEAHLPGLWAALPWWFGGHDRRARIVCSDPATAGGWSFPGGQLPLRAVDGPDLLISCGRRGALIAQAWRHAGCFVVHLQDPQIPVSRFDRVVAPEHDQLVGANVLSNFGALHRYSPQRLQAIRALETAPWGSRWNDLPRPWLMVLVGGPTRRWKPDPATLERWSQALDVWAARSGGSVLVTPSRRTPDEARAILRAGLRRWQWDGQGDNPYAAMLALGDAFAVSGDSVSMLSEAVATGKPLAVLGGDGFPQRLGRRLARFHASLVQRDLVVALDRLDTEAGGVRGAADGRPTGQGPRAPQPVDETGRVAARIREDFRRWWQQQGRGIPPA